MHLFFGPVVKRIQDDLSCVMGLVRDSRVVFDPLRWEIAVTCRVFLWDTNLGSSFLTRVLSLR